MIETQKLTRAYGDTVVVDGVDLQVRPGRVTGFVGANGAGKTTTMRMIMGVLAPTTGEVLWNGSPVDAADRHRFGYMPEERGLYPRMKLLDQLVFFARLHGLSSADARERAGDLLGHFGLDDRAGDLLDTLSLGNQQRVQIAAALVHRPTALILDEPFSGLDPLAVDAMTDLLRTEAVDVPVLFSSHQLELVERLCDDLVILAEGRVVAAGAVDDLRAGGPERYRVVLDGEDAVWLRDLRGVTVRDVDGPVAVLDLDGMSPTDLGRAVVARSGVVEIARVRESLSQIYREAIA